MNRILFSLTRPQIHKNVGFDAKKLAFLDHAAYLSMVDTGYGWRISAGRRGVLCLNHLSRRLGITPPGHSEPVGNIHIWDYQNYDYRYR